MKAKKYIAYRRVSTREQGISGLGLDDQLHTIKTEVIRIDGSLIGDFKDVISGRSKKRPALMKAILECEKSGATLIVKNMDRLGRDASYLFEIRDRLKKIHFVESPEMSFLEFGMRATFAQEEAERISERTKAGLAARERLTGKRNGSKKGDTPTAAIAASRIARKERAMTLDSNLVAGNLVRMWMKEGHTYNEVARRLNEAGLKTPTGKEYSGASVQRLVKLYNLKGVAN